MTEQDLELLEQAARLIITVLERGRINAENVRERRLQFRMFVNDNPPPVPQHSPTESAQTNQKEIEEKGSFIITQEEITKMSKNIKGKFHTKGFTVCWRKRLSGKYSYTYQIRFQKSGYNIQFHEKCKENLKPRFLEELKKQTDNPSPVNNRVPTTFTSFAEFYFENFRKLKVTEKTYQTDTARFYLHIKPYFLEKRLKDITPSECQILLDDIKARGKEKTADEIYSLLNGIFNYAVKHRLLEYSPTETVVHFQHERVHGKALTKEEETALLKRYKGTTYEIPFAVALYTGMRPSEYDSAQIKEGIIISLNRKRKNKKTVYKRIAISPMLSPYLKGIDTLSFPRPETMREKLKAVIPNHRLYDLRTTFNTRCKECGVADPARLEFMGHSLGELGNAYTDLSDEYLIKEGQKLIY